MVSADGVRYDFQAVGEFIFAQSEDLDAELQVRLAPYGRSLKPDLEPTGSARYLSVVSALAFNSNGSRLTVDVIRDANNRVQIDGVPVGVASEEERFVVHESGFHIYHHPNEVYEVWTPQNVRLKFAVYSAHINLDLAFPFHQSASVTGLLGARDGDPSNDFTTRDGEIIAHERGNLSRRDLYDRFGNSWRITQAESLFEYADGESTKTYTNLALPEKTVSISDLSPEIRAEAERVCRDAGIPPGPVFNNCVYDVGFSGDEQFALTYVYVGGGDDAAMPNARDEIPADAIATLAAPDTVGAGAPVEIMWAGPENHRDYISLAKPGAISGRYETFQWAQNSDAPVVLTAPGEPGTYELRYVIDENKQIIARREINIIAVGADLKAPDSVEAGSTFTIDWTGPANDRDFISLARPEQTSGGRYETYNWVPAEGEPVALLAPGHPGTYELRYVLNSDRQIIATRQIEVRAASAELNAPESVEPGAEFEVRWTGPANDRDFISLAKPEETSGGRYETYDWVPRDGTPITLVAPQEPGDYELRYVLNSDRHIVATRMIAIGK